MLQNSRTEVTRLLQELKNGNQEALEKLAPLIYRQLQQMASRYLRNEASAATLQTTDLVHEAYLRLVDEQQFGWENRAHFFAIAARAMRQYLIKYARSRKAAKRGGNIPTLSLNEDLVASEQKSPDILALDAALLRLAGYDKRLSQLVELRYFAGLTIEETAHVLAISPATVKREWVTARAWLYQELRP